MRGRTKRLLVVLLALVCLGWTGSRVHAMYARRAAQPLIERYLAAEIVPDYYDLYQEPPVPETWDDVVVPSQEYDWLGAVVVDGVTARVTHKLSGFDVHFEDQSQPLTVITGDYAGSMELRWREPVLYALVRVKLFTSDWHIYELDLEQRQLLGETRIELDWLGRRDH